MRDAFALWCRYAAISLRAQLAYRATFVVKTVGHLVVTGIEFFAIWSLFARFGSLAGWTLPEVALLYGLAEVAFALADGLGRGFDRMSALLVAGDFDRMLLRPRSVVLQLLGYEPHLMRTGRLAQGAVVLAWACAAGGIAWTPARAALAAFAIAGAACAYLGVVVLQATTSFWTIQTLEVWSAFVYGGQYANEYPMSIYTRWFRRFFTFVIPLALVGYYPALAILGRDELDVWHAVSPIAGVAFLAIALALFRLGVRRHASTGS